MDPKGGIANIKKKIPIPNYKYELNNESYWKDYYYKAVFQRKQNVKILVKVSDYNSKAGKLKL